MINFQYTRAADLADAVKQIAADPAAKFIAGGTNLIDLMRGDVERPTRLIDISRLPLTKVEETDAGGLRIGALVPNSDLAYHPLIEKRYPRTKVNWRVLASGTPITQGVITGDIQIGAMGTGPFLVGWARGVKWKIIAPLNLGDLWLMARDRGIRTIGDLRGKRIATPTNTSIQAVMLRKMAQVRTGCRRC